MSGSSGEDKRRSGLPHSSSPTTTSFPRATIPHLAARNSAVDDQIDMKSTGSSDGTHEAKARSQPKSNDKGKEPIRGDRAPYGRDTFHYNDTTSYNSTRPFTAQGFPNGRSKFRGSLVAASDALSSKFGRRKPSIRQPPRPIVLPGVIEISAPRRDEEVEERNRLREMAAQAIGLGPFMVSQGNESREESTTDDEDEEHSPSDNSDPRHLGYPRNSESTPNIAARPLHDSSLYETLPAQSSSGRFRSGSMLVHNTTTTAIIPIPSFPSSVSALTSFMQSGGVYPKYYPPSSLRIFAFSKNWKSRFLLLSSPARLVTRGQSPAVSYLHLFKSSGPEEKELERLEINEASVVFVAEEEVGGRRHVIKVGGADVGARKKEYTHEEGGYTMWLLQIIDQAEAQRWITNIKNAILGQRTVRAGLIPAHTLGKNEPRGDMDVMLSIRAQALVTSSASKPHPTHNTSSQNASQDPHYASSISSHSATSQRTGSKSAGVNGPVSALKGLFATSTRPRSGSRAASVDFESQQERDSNDESFTSMRSLLSMLRPNTPDTPHTPINRTTNLPISGPVDLVDRRIDRKILVERQPIQWEAAAAEQPPVNRDRANRALSLGAISLQPPPRKRWASTRPISELSSPNSSGVGKQPNGTGVQANNLSVPGSGSSTGRDETEPPYTPNQLSAFNFGTPEQKSCAPSLRSVSTINDGDPTSSNDRSSLSTKRSSGPRRWSRQGVLPNRLTPPSEPPPAIPGNHSTLLHPYAAEREPSPTPSRSSQKSVVSTLPSFSKRASSSSARSVNSYDATQSHNIATGASSSTNGAISVRSTASHRVSMPPPRPPPTAALPPAPVQEPQDTLTPSEVPPPSKSTFRNSVSQRAFRLSATAPKPPPSTNLPPRPDEPELKTHRRSSSGSYSMHGHSNSTKLESIPGSPVPPSKSISPFPPPVGPLPPTPPPTSSPSPQLFPAKRASSIKQRLRMLSAPLPSAGQLENAPNPPQRASLIFTHTPPVTPIAEKITLFQNDPSFLQMHTPPLPSQPLNLSLFPPLVEENPGITSLSPPPRRGSKQLLETTLESPKRIAVPDETLLTVGGEPRHLSLSRPGSIMSINISPCWPLQETDSDSSPTLDMTPTDELLEESPEELSEKSTFEPRHLSLSRPGSVLSLGIMAL